MTSPVFEARFIAIDVDPPAEDALVEGSGPVRMLGRNSKIRDPARPKHARLLGTGTHEAKVSVTARSRATGDLAR